MNPDQQTIRTLLTTLIADKNYEIKPARKEQINIFYNRALHHGVDISVIRQLIDLYEVADFFHYDIIIGFHHCDDLTIFDWWTEKELWLGLRDFNIIRWTDNKFCLGDASNISFSSDCEFKTLIELIEGCILEIQNTERE